MTLRAVFFLPAFFFIVSQIVSVCGAFEVMSSYADNGMEDLSLEEIVFIDPFLKSIERASSAHFVAQKVVAQTIRSILNVFAQQTYVKQVSERLCFNGERQIPPAPNLWLADRVLRI